MARDIPDNKNGSTPTTPAPNTESDLQKYAAERKLRDEFVAAKKRNAQARAAEIQESSDDDTQDQTQNPVQEEPISTELSPALSADTSDKEENNQPINVESKPTPESAITPNPNIHIDEEHEIERDKAQTIEASKEAEAGISTASGPVLNTEKNIVLSDEYRADEEPETSLAEDQEAETLVYAIKNFRIDLDNPESSVLTLQGLLLKAHSLMAKGALPPAAMGRITAAVMEGGNKMTTAKAAVEHEEERTERLTERTEQAAQNALNAPSAFKKHFNRALHAGHHHDENGEEIDDHKKHKHHDVNDPNHQHLGFNIHDPQHHIPDQEAKKHSLDHLQTAALKDQARDVKKALAKDSKKDTYLGDEIRARKAVKARAKQLEKSKESFESFTANLPEEQAAKLREEQAAKRQKREERDANFTSVDDEFNELGVSSFFDDADASAEKHDARAERAKAPQSLLDDPNVEDLGLDTLFQETPEQSFDDIVEEAGLNLAKAQFSLESGTTLSSHKHDVDDDIPDLSSLFAEDDQQTLANVSKTLSDHKASLNTQKEDEKTQESHAERIQQSKSPQGPAL